MDVHGQLSSMLPTPPNRLLQLSAVICCIGWMLPALAAPPVPRPVPTAPGAAVENLFSARNGLKASPSPIQALPSHLDLRPPSGEFGEASRPTGATRLNEDYGIGRRGQFANYQRDDRDTLSSAPAALGRDGVQARPLGLAQGIAERFHREGLPVARLWENHSALVSLGLNQKGKPGIWLVQKTH